MPPGPRRHHGAPHPLGAGDRVVRVPRRVAMSLEVDTTLARRGPFPAGTHPVIAFASLIFLGTVLLALPAVAGRRPGAGPAGRPVHRNVRCLRHRVDGRLDPRPLVAVRADRDPGADPGRRPGLHRGRHRHLLAGRPAHVHPRAPDVRPAHRSRRTRRPEGPVLAHRHLHAVPARRGGGAAVSAGPRRLSRRQSALVVDISRRLGLHQRGVRHRARLQQLRAAGRRSDHGGHPGGAGDHRRHRVHGDLRRAAAAAVAAPGAGITNRPDGHAGPPDRGIPAATGAFAGFRRRGARGRPWACGRTPRSIMRSGARPASRPSIWAVSTPIR